MVLPRSIPCVRCHAVPPEEPAGRGKSGWSRTTDAALTSITVWKECNARTERCASPRHGEGYGTCRRYLALAPLEPNRLRELATRPTDSVFLSVSIERSRPVPFTMNLPGAFVGSSTVTVPLPTGADEVT